MRMPAGVVIRNRLPGAAAQPAPSSRDTATASSGTGTHTLSPERP